MKRILLLCLLVSTPVYAEDQFKIHDCSKLSEDVCCWVENGNVRCWWKTPESIEANRKYLQEKGLVK